MKGPEASPSSGSHLRGTPESLRALETTLVLPSSPGLRHSDLIGSELGHQDFFKALQGILTGSQG